MKALVNFLILQWKMKAIEELYLNALIENGKITDEENKIIIATEQVITA